MGGALLCSRGTQEQDEARRETERWRPGRTGTGVGRGVDPRTDTSQGRGEAQRAWRGGGTGPGPVIPGGRPPQLEEHRPTLMCLCSDWALQPLGTAPPKRRDLSRRAPLGAGSQAERASRPGPAPPRAEGIANMGRCASSGPADHRGEERLGARPSTLWAWVLRSSLFHGL